MNRQTEKTQIEQRLAQTQDPRERDRLLDQLIALGGRRGADTRPKGEEVEKR